MTKLRCDHTAPSVQIDVWFASRLCLSNKAVAPATVLQGNFVILF